DSSRRCDTGRLGRGGAWGSDGFFAALRCGQNGARGRSGTDASFWRWRTRQPCRARSYACCNCVLERRPQAQVECGAALWPVERERGAQAGAQRAEAEEAEVEVELGAGREEGRSGRIAGACAEPIEGLLRAPR